MASIQQILQRETNPFDPTTYKIFSFWDEQPIKTPVVESIHQDVFAQVESTLHQVIQDQNTRTLVIAGDSGSGKSILLNRIKEKSNSKAFFAYVGSWTDGDLVWRHTLRQVVDSLLQTPKGQSESQLILWLEKLSVFSDRKFQKWLLGERRLFIQKLRSTYPTGIYNASEFFGILYDLTNPELRPLACEWLKGDDLAEEDLKALNVKRAIDNEDAAQKVLANIGKIAAETYPIVICFDNLDSIPRLADNSLDLQPLFNLNTTVHSQRLRNFLIIISLVTNDLKQSLKHIQQADKASVYRWLDLKSISLDQAEQIWASRLHPLHQQANPKPGSPIAPLVREQLEKVFPGGKASPRSVMQLGYQLIKKIDVSITSNGHVSLIAAFKLLWLREMKEAQSKITRFRHFSSPELTAMLQKVLVALQVKTPQLKLLSGAYTSHSLSYQHPKRSAKIGVVWTEEPSMTSFFHMMNACQKVANQKCQELYLIRAEKLGSSKNKGTELFKQIFSHTPNHHLVPDISSLHYLATYAKLANAACSGDLMILDKVISLDQLESLTREAQVLADCILLQKLEILPEKIGPIPHPDPLKAKEYILAFMSQHQLVCQKVIYMNAHNQFSDLTEIQSYQIVQELCQEKRVSILDQNSLPPDQIVCLIPEVAVA